MKKAICAAIGLMWAALAGCSRPADAAAPLHRAANNLQLALARRADAKSLAQASAQLKREVDRAQAALPARAGAVCGRAVTAADSLGRILDVIRDGDLQRLAAMRADLQNADVIRTPGDWDALAGRLSYLLPGGDDSEMMGELRQWLSQSLATDVAAGANSGAQAAVRACLRATSPV